MKIVPVNRPGFHRTGCLEDIDVATITEVLGFAPNVNDDPDKVVNSWGFKIDDQDFGIWDYKGSHIRGAFSTYGSAKILSKLFPNNYF